MSETEIFHGQLRCRSCTSIQKIVFSLQHRCEINPLKSLLMIRLLNYRECWEKTRALLLLLVLLLVLVQQHTTTTTTTTTVLILLPLLAVLFICTTLHLSYNHSVIQLLTCLLYLPVNLQSVRGAVTGMGGLHSVMIVEQPRRKLPTHAGASYTSRFGRRLLKTA